MTNSDNILEAERIVRNIANELARMRDAANLLQDSQERSTAVLSIAERLMGEVEKFSHEVEALTAKLAMTDLSQILGNMSSDTERIVNSISESGKESGRALAGLERTLDALRSDIERGTNSTVENHTRTNEAITELSSVLSVLTANMEKVEGRILELKEILDRIALIESRVQAEAKAAKVRQIWTMAFAIAAFLAAAGGIVFNALSG